MLLFDLMINFRNLFIFFFFFQAEDGIRDDLVTGVQTCALPIFLMRERTKPKLSAIYYGR